MPEPDEPGVPGAVASVGAIEPLVVPLVVPSTEPLPILLPPVVGVAAGAVFRLSLGAVAALSDPTVAVSSEPPVQPVASAVSDNVNAAAKTLLLLFAFISTSLLLQNNLVTDLSPSPQYSPWTESFFIISSTDSHGLKALVANFLAV
jgi:hypothetical protein